MRFLVISAALFGVVTASPANAGVFGDDLSRCMVTKASPTDVSSFVAWMFSAISSDPKLQKYTTLDRAQRDKIAATTAEVMQRLVFVDCRKEAVAAVKAEGEDSLTSSFRALGEAAAQQMFQSPQAQAELESLGKNFDDQKTKSLEREAGILDKAPSKEAAKQPKK